MAIETSGYLIYLAVLAGVLHACLQLPLATLLHMAGHTLGRGEAGKALALGFSFSLGVFLTVVGLLIAAVLLMLALPENARFLVAGLLATASGVVVMLGYFRGRNGAQLWLSRRYIRWFHKYIERRHNALSAFSLGNISVLLELGFSLPLLLCTGALLASSSTETMWQSFGLCGLIVAAPLLFTAISLSGGTNMLHMQTWRAEGKRFWQFFVGLGFILFGLYVASEPVIRSGVSA